ncbi:MAG: hypothetical protein JWO19_2283 [Bryobacterales bacterium]|nr:hypothetical protein [Bryobacterales bacterium]
MTGSSPAHSGERNLHLTVLMLAACLVLGLIPQQASSEGTPDMKINITVSGKTVTATIMDNPTAKDFVSLLPLTMSMKDLFGREKFGHLQRALSGKGPRTSTYEVGDIAYWSPTHDFAVYYHQDGETIPSPGIIPIGKIKGGAEVFNVPGSVEVTIEIAK